MVLGYEYEKVGFWGTPNMSRFLHMAIRRKYTPYVIPNWVYTTASNVALEPSALTLGRPRIVLGRPRVVLGRPRAGLRRPRAALGVLKGCVIIVPMSNKSS